MFLSSSFIHLSAQPIHTCFYWSKSLIINLWHIHISSPPYLSDHLLYFMFLFKCIREPSILKPVFTNLPKRILIIRKLQDVVCIRHGYSTGYRQKPPWSWEGGGEAKRLFELNLSQQIILRLWVTTQSNLTSQKLISWSLTGFCSNGFKPLKVSFTKNKTNRRLPSSLSEWR